MWDSGEHLGDPLGAERGIPARAPFLCPPARPLPSADLYCTLEVDSFGYFVSKAKTRVFRDTTEPKWDEVSGCLPVPQTPPQFPRGGDPVLCVHPAPVALPRGLSLLPGPQEFEIELEGSQSLRILCYEKCYDKTKVNKDNNEIVDKIMGKGQIQVRGQRGCVPLWGLEPDVPVRVGAGRHAHIHTPAAVPVALLLVPSGLGRQLGAVGLRGGTGSWAQGVTDPHLMPCPQQVLPGNTEGGSGQHPGVWGVTDRILSGT